MKQLREADDVNQLRGGKGILLVTIDKTENFQTQRISREFYSFWLFMKHRGKHWKCLLRHWNMTKKMHRRGAIEISRLKYVSLSFHTTRVFHETCSDVLEGLKAYEGWNHSAQVSIKSENWNNNEVFATRQSFIFLPSSFTFPFISPSCCFLYRFCPKTSFVSQIILIKQAQSGM